MFFDKENALEQCTRREDQLEFCFVVSYILESKVAACLCLNSLGRDLK